MKGIIQNLESTEKLYKFKINNKNYVVSKSTHEDTLMDGFEIEFSESVTKGKQKDDGDFWPDTIWANKITILDDSKPNIQVKQFKADPDKQLSIERQSAIKSAVDFYSERGQATIENVLDAAKKFYDFIKNG